MGNTITAESPVDVQMGVKVTKSDGTVYEHDVEANKEDLKQMFDILQLVCTMCRTVWLEQSKQFEQRQYIYCPNCGNKEVNE